MRRGTIGIAFACALVLAARPRAASAGDPPAAQALFKQGRDAAKRGDHATACEKFAESYRLDPAPGTLLNLGDCKERLGMLASAWQYYTAAAEQLSDERTDIARQRSRDGSAS
jgi:tetratricopeptide (TPR) repeat protein